MSERRYKSGTLGEIALDYYLLGEDAANTKLESLAPLMSRRPFELIKHDRGRPSVRTDVDEADGIKYTDYSPSVSWNLPFTILLARFSEVAQTDFMTHPGEEVLLPLQGGVFYHLFGASCEKSLPERFQLGPITAGEIIALDSAVPHHTWGQSSDTAAWMIIRHSRQSQTAIVHTPPTSSELHQTNPRKISLSTLSDLGKYALNAWGIADRIKYHREKSGCRISDIAENCALDPGYVSRIERAEVNPSVETLLTIAEFLNFRVEDLLAPTFHEPISCQHLARSKKKNEPVSVEHDFDALRNSSNRTLRSWFIPAGLTPLDHKSIHGLYECSSWIVLSGQVVFECSPDGKTTTLLAETGDVLHLRRDTAKTAYSLKDSRLLQIVYHQHKALSV